MNVSTVRARAIVTELLAAGVQDVALAPGSRSAPIALALAAAERAGLVRLHVRVDERSAGYLALGAAKASRRPAAVVTTSGTAAVNLHPALTEASYAGIPLIAITADRPAELRDVGANQTIRQVGLFGAAVRWSADVDLETTAAVRSVVARAVAMAVSEPFPGPVHLNVPLPMPLVPDDDWSVELPGAPQVRDLRIPTGAVPTLEDCVPDAAGAERGLILVGDVDDPSVRDLARDLSGATGWPIVSEPTGGCSAVAGALSFGPLLLSALTAGTVRPDIVVTVGRVGLSRSFSEIVAGAGTHVAVDPRPLSALSDPTRTAAVVLARVPWAAPRASGTWAQWWHAADQVAGEVVAAVLDGEGADAERRPSGPAIARRVAQSLGADDLLVIGPSWPIRHVANYVGPVVQRVLANRGTSGIDGVVSTAWGAALAHHRETGASTVCLLGDLTALYDRNGLLAAPGESQPPLTFVVIDNNGGGIFSALEQGDERFASDFERVFGTPHGADLPTLLQAPDVSVLRVTSLFDLAAALASPHRGVRVIVVVADSRPDEARVISRVREDLRAQLEARGLAEALTSASNEGSRALGAQLGGGG